MALTDVLFRRYPWVVRNEPEAAEGLRPFFIQLVGVIVDDLAPHLPDRRAVFKQAEALLAREMGCGTLVPEVGDPIEACGRFLAERYDVWDGRHGDPNWFVRTRLSLVELLFRLCEGELLDERPRRGGILGALDNSLASRRARAFRDAVVELNSRMRDARVPFHYHNGFMQFANDEVTARELEEPFWEILKDPKWRNVDQEMKRALDLRDERNAEAAFHALKALESAAKVVCDERGWTTGTEKGASNFIDNLVSKANGRLLEPWEGEIVKRLFKDVRNPQGHGAGSEALVPLSAHQVDVVVEMAMSWIKTLSRRS